MHDYNTILGVIELRLSKVSYDSVQKRYRIGRSGIALIMNRYKDSGLSLDDLRQMPASKVVDLIYPKENLRHKDIPLPDFEKIHEQMIQMGKHADLSFLWIDYKKEHPNGYQLAQFYKRKIIHQKKEVILHGAGINLEEYSYCPYPDNEKIHFLYLGRIMKEKGMDELFGAVEKLREEGYDFVLDLVGFFEDEYKEQVEHLESEGIVKFHGFQENPKPYYEKADCVVLPSYHEGIY